MAAAEFTDDEVNRMKPEARWELEGFRALTKRQVDFARQVQHDLRRSVCALLDEFDLLALPTAQCWPFPAYQHWPSSVCWRSHGHLPPVDGGDHRGDPGGMSGARSARGCQRCWSAHRAAAGRTPGGDAELLAWAREAERRGVFTVAPPSVASAH